MGSENVNTEALLEKLRHDGEASDDALALMASMLEVYERGELIRDGTAVPLDRYCPHCAECWAKEAPASHPTDMEEAGVSVPFVGPDFFTYRIVTCGLNMHDYGGLGANWWICRGHIYDTLGQGHRKSFSLGVGAYLTAVRRSVEGVPQETDPPTPQNAAHGWLATAFVEMVKCAPLRRASEPTDAMVRNCPDFLLKDELRHLGPRILLVLGKRAVARLAELFDTGIRTWDRGLARERIDMEHGPVEVVGCYHPAYPRWWPHSYAALVESLTERPLTPAGS